MQNLIRFIWKHHFTVLFLLLQFVAFTLVVQTNSFHNSRFISATNTISGSVYQSITSFKQYFTLKRTNEILAKENARLRANSKHSFVPIKGHLVSVNDTLHRRKYTYTPALVVNSSVNKSNNFLILNKGSDQGVKPEMGVIGPNGVVGIVRDVSANFSSVFSVLHSKSKISAKLEGQEYYGIVEWLGTDPAYVELRNIPKHVEVKQGNTVVTRGGSAIFPEEIGIGKVEDVKEEHGGNFHEITVKLSTDFSKLRHVYIVNNLLKLEQIELEKAFKEEEDE